MPEVWFPYGAVEVAVDIRAENLAGILEATRAPLSAEDLQQRVSVLNPQPRVALLGVSPAILAALKALLAIWREHGAAAVTILCARPELARVRKALEGAEVAVGAWSEPRPEPGHGQGHIMGPPSELTQGDCLFVSEAEFDPLFGFGGGPVALLQRVRPELRAEAFLTVGTSEPQPATETAATKVAREAMTFALDSPALEVVALDGGVSAAVAGTLASAHEAATARLLETTKIPLPAPARAVLAAAGRHMDGDLRSALRTLWNLLGGLRHEGSVALLAECTYGLGSAAVKEFVAGRLQLTHALRQRKYVDGMEDLVYLETARQRHDLILASTVPLHYAHEKLGFRVARKANHALELLLAKQGARAKVHLVPRAGRSLLRTE